MIGWGVIEVAGAAEATIVRGGPGEPRRAVIDSRSIQEGDLFVGIAGARSDGGAFAGAALAAGAWGVLVAPTWARELEGDRSGDATVLAAGDPVVALGRLARAWRRRLGCHVLAITGSTGKTSTKDILAAVLSNQRRTHANRANLNTEIGLPLAVLEAPPDTETLVLELAMRGAGQIAELAAICEPDVGVIVNIGPVHLELMGSLEAVAAAKAELLTALPAGSRAVLPVAEPLLERHVRSDLDVWRFGPGGDAQLLGFADGRATIGLRGRELVLEPDFSQAHQLGNLVAAVAAADAVGVVASGRLDVVFSALRGERVELPGPITLINDAYNANPTSMRAALDELAATAPRRRVAVLGDMLELGAEGPRFHRQLGDYASESGVALLIAVGPLAAVMLDRFAGEGHSVADAAAASALLGKLLGPGDTVLVKGSRSVGLERVCEALAARLAVR